MSDDPHPHRRAEDDAPVLRATGHTARQLALQVAGGVLIAGIVGAISAWGTQQIIGVRLEVLTREVQQLRGEVYEMRRDLYRPRYGAGDHAPGVQDSGFTHQDLLAPSATPPPTHIVTPAKAGAQSAAAQSVATLDSGVRRNDERNAPPSPATPAKFSPVTPANAGAQSFAPRTPWPA